MGFQDYYDSVWMPRGDYFVHHRLRFQHTWDAVEALAGMPGRVLDVGGTSAGPIAQYLATRGWEVQCTQGDLRGPLPHPEDWFDLVLCTEVIEHIKDVDSGDLHALEAFNYSGVENMLREVRRGMRRNARLLITTPNAASWHMLAKWLYGELQLADPGHVREFTPVGLTRTAHSCGLHLEWLKTLDSWSLGMIPMVRTIGDLLPADLTLPPIPREDNIVAMFSLG